MGKLYKNKSIGSKTFDKELDKHQKMFHEIKQLEQEVDRLNTIIKRMEKGSCQKCAEVKLPQNKKKSVESKPCQSCEGGTLLKIEYSKGDGSWAFDKCDSCKYRSVGKKL